MNGFQAFEGGLALLGVESDKVQEALLRVQSVMALTQGINGILEAKDAFSQLGVVAKGALKGIKTELIATGIGALVVALGTIVAYWEDIKGLVGGVNDETKKNVELTQAKLTKSERELDVFEKQEAQLRLQGKTEEEIIKLREEKIKKVVETAKKEKALHEANKKAEVAAAQRNQKFAQYIIQTYAVGLSMGLYIITGIIDGISNAFTFLAKASFNYGKQLRNIMFEALISPLELALKGVNKLLELAGASTFDVKAIFGTIRDTYAGIENQIGGFINSLEGTSLSKGLFELTDKYVSQQLASVLFDPKAVAETYDKTIEGVEDKILDGESKIAQGKLQINQKYAQNAKDLNSKSEKEKLDLERQNIDKRIELMADGYEKEAALAREKAKREKEDLLASSKDKIVDAEQLAEAQKLIDDKLKKDLRDLDNKYNSDKALTWEQKNKKDLDEKKIEIDNELAAAGERIRIKEEEAAKKKIIDEEEKARIKALNEFRITAAQDTLQMVSNLTELFAGQSESQQRKAFQIQKAVNIANAVIDTYKAANAALASAPPPFNYIAMAATITAGLLNVKKIASQKFEASGSSGGGGGSNAPAAAPMTANFSTIGSSGINQLAQLQQKPTQAYVVSGEVTSAQALDRNRVQNATL
jgi:hypothetical protein